MIMLPCCRAKTDDYISHFQTYPFVLRFVPGSSGSSEIVSLRCCLDESRDVSSSRSIPVVAG